MASGNIWRRIRLWADSLMWIVPKEQRVLSPFRYHARHRPQRLQPIEYIVGHYTASPYEKDLPNGSDRNRILRWGRGEGRESSTTFTILRTGEIIQMMPLSDRAWHVRDEFIWAGDGKGKTNNRAIGFDFENVGFLKQRNGKFYNDYGGVHKGPVAFVGDEPWEALTDAQIVSAKWLVRRLGELFPKLRDGNPLRLVGHSDLQPTRRDPGPLCPMEDLRKALMGDVEEVV